jgi:membrane-associated phospholipid phosphatase
MRAGARRSPRERSANCLERAGMMAKPRIERLFWTSTLAAAYCGYPLIGRHQEEARAHSLAVGLDAWIPFSPSWMFVYVAIYPMLLLPCLVVREIAFLRRVGCAYLFVLGIGFLTFLAFPVTTATFRPSIPSLSMATFSEWGAALNYAFDPPLNCFPSLHVATCTLAARVMRKVDTRLYVASAVVAALIAVSTMMVKQHYAADVAGGAVLAFLADCTFIAGHPREHPGRVPGRRNIARGAFCALVYVVMVSGFYLLFKSEYQPSECSKCIARVRSATHGST